MEGISSSVVESANNLGIEGISSNIVESAVERNVVPESTTTTNAEQEEEEEESSTAGLIVGLSTLPDSLIVGPSTSSDGLHQDPAAASSSSGRASNSSSYRVRLSISSSSRRSRSSSSRRSNETAEEASSCLMMLIAFWFLAASMTLILGFYGSVNLVVGPNYSRLVHANSFFVQEIKVNGDKKPGPMLYGFSEQPPLDIRRSWNQTHHVLVPSNHHQEWMFWLNKGSVLSVSYNVKADDFSQLILIIAEGKMGLNEWIEDPTYPNISLSWNSVHGNGTIEQKVDKNSEYYVAVGNLNPHSMEVYLNFKMNSVLYDTTEANYKCPLQQDLCGVKLFLLGGNYAILTTPGPTGSTDKDEWYVKLSYGPRWLTYVVGSGGLILLILLMQKLFIKLRLISEEPELQSEELPPERTPLIPQKDGDDSSCGSSYVSLSQGEEDDERFFSGSPRAEGTDINSQNSEIYQRRLCAICFDDPRDSFFLPCGHCAACFTCGMRIAEESSLCPICRKKIRRVRKIFTV